MSIDDEIRLKKQSMQDAIDAEARRRAESERISKAFRDADMSGRTPILRMPTRDLQRVIEEAMPRMIFRDPKIIRRLPDGTTRARSTKSAEGERADEYSFDVDVIVDHRDKTVYRTSIWFFKNGLVAFCRDEQQIDSINVDASVIRDKIIETIASKQITNEHNSSISNTSNLNKKSNNSSEGCYIATAVYGSYDCPEVWILRRYRDYVLKSTWYGKVFIKAYYALSPMLVRVFGNRKWFQHFWRHRLDSITDKLQKRGFSDKSYDV